VGLALAPGTALTFIGGGSPGSAASFTGSGFTVLNHDGTGSTLLANVGGWGRRDSGTVAISGDGGASPFAGGGPRGRINTGVGAAGRAPGAGGAGAASFNAGGAMAGGASPAGLIVIREYS
jgi:hypothetical protein